jgi:hypothetical protein
MPRIANHIVNCSIFLYKSEAAAKTGERFGGSGFLVHESSDSGAMHVYAVTNKHLLDGGFHTIRLTKKTGGVETVKTKPDDWTHNPNGNDVAVISLDIGTDFEWWSVGTDIFITREIISAYNIGLGDEAFLIGRLVNHAGKQRNAPIARFGNVSLMADPKEPIQCEGREQEGFLVECRSLSGFSGSPVFVETRQEYDDEAANAVAQHRGEHFLRKTGPPGYVEHAQGDGREWNWVKGKFGPWLLGIDWGHVPLWNPVYAKPNLKATKTGDWIEANTGIACVLPAWHILETLNDKELMKQRHEQNQERDKRLKDESISVNDAALEPSAQPFSKDDFETALKKAARRVSSKK